MTAFDELMSEFKKAGKKIDKLKVINEDLLKEKNEFHNKYDSLRNDCIALTSKSDILKEENKAHMIHIESLESENLNLKREIQKLKPIIDKMTLSSSKLELLLTSKRDSYDKTGIGYNLMGDGSRGSLMLDLIKLGRNQDSEIEKPLIKDTHNFQY